jgi:hypothetical protein
MTIVIARICVGAANITCSAKEKSDRELAPHGRASEICAIGTWKKSQRKTKPRNYMHEKADHPETLVLLTCQGCMST